MREGDKNRLFIPYYLGYGEETYGPFPQIWYRFWCRINKSREVIC
jgi:hypothetical protein